MTFEDGATVIGSASVANGKATLAHVFPHGKHVLTAVYGGNASYLPSTSPTVTITVR